MKMAQETGEGCCCFDIINDIMQKDYDIIILWQYHNGARNGQLSHHL
jgi:hypothetical protein